MFLRHLLSDAFKEKNTIWSSSISVVSTNVYVERKEYRRRTYFSNIKAVQIKIKTALELLMFIQ